MISFCYDPPFEVSGRTLIVVSRVSLGWLQRNGVLAFFGDKRPVAIICREKIGEKIFGVDGRRIDASALQDLIDLSIAGKVEVAVPRRRAFHAATIIARRIFAPAMAVWRVPFRSIHRALF